MAPARRTRIQDEPSYDGDTDPGSEPETPRPQKSNLKKRVSEAYHLDADGSFTNSDPTRLPLKSVNLNDDAAEKRRRRKSTKLAVIDDLTIGGASGENPSDQGTGPEASRPTRQKQQINTVAPPAEMNVPLDVMSSNFEEWMKMATDNVRL